MEDTALLKRSLGLGHLLSLSPQSLLESVLSSGQYICLVNSSSNLLVNRGGVPVLMAEEGVLSWKYRV